LDGAETLPVSVKEASMFHPDSGTVKQKIEKENKTKVKGEKTKGKDAKAKSGDSSGGSGGVEKEREGEGEVPLQMRRHGFDVYWNGRLIPEAHFERYFIDLFFK
jgi:hypothetical protein